MWFAFYFFLTPHVTHILYCRYNYYCYHYYCYNYYYYYNYYYSQHLERTGHYLTVKDNQVVMLHPSW
jgi:hypothetical protein